MHMAKSSIFVLLKCKVKTVDITIFTLHLSKTKIDNFAICMVYKFDMAYRQIPTIYEIRYIGMTEKLIPINQYTDIFGISEYRTFLISTHILMGSWNSMENFPGTLPPLISNSRRGNSEID
jgi:hypothetical protein